MSDEYILYWGYEMGSAPVQALLLELELPHRLEQVNFGSGEHRNPEYLALNPVGKVPALHLPDGNLMTESAAMLIYLADLQGDGGFLPLPQDRNRAQALRWMLYLASELYPTACHYYEAANYVDDEAAEAAVTEKARDSFGQQCRFLEDQASGEEYFLGQHFTVVDLYLTTILAWHYDPSAVQANCPKLAAITERVHRRPVVRQAFTLHKMTL